MQVSCIKLYPQVKISLTQVLKQWQRLSSILLQEHRQRHSADGSFPVFVGAGNGGDFLRRRVSYKNLSLHFARSLEDGFFAYGIYDGKSNRPNLEDARVGDNDIRKDLSAEHAVAKHGFPVNVQGDDLGFNGNRNYVNNIIHFPDIILVVVEIVDII